jgi:hypothetical protein
LASENPRPDPKQSSSYQAIPDDTVANLIRDDIVANLIRDDIVGVGVAFVFGKREPKA